MKKIFNIVFCCIVIFGVTGCGVVNPFKYFEKKEKIKEEINNRVEDESNNFGENNQNNNGRPDSKIEDITFKKNKVNIYLFWGNGCPHCEEEFEFLESIKDKYGKYFNLYAFETWYNDDNRSLMNEFLKGMGDKKGGVPYTVIGDESFTGFSSSYEEKIIEAIMDKYDDDDDIYKEIKDTVIKNRKTVIEKSFLVSNIQLSNQNYNYNYILEKEEVILKVKGPKNLIDDIDEENLEAYVDVKNLDIGQHSVKIEPPELSNKLDCTLVPNNVMVNISNR